MIRITPEPFLKSMTSQGEADQFYCHTTNFIPEVDISGVQHYSLESTTNNIIHTSDMHTHFTAGTGTALVSAGSQLLWGLDFIPSERTQYSTIHWHDVCWMCMSVFQKVFTNIQVPVSNFSCTVPPDRTPWLSLSHPAVLPAVLGFYRWNILTSNPGVSALLSHHQKELPRNHKTNSLWALGLRQVTIPANNLLIW